MTEVTYSLSNTKQVPDRFRGDHELRYNLPSTVDEIRALVADGVDPDEVIVAGFNGQGYRLSIQKRIQDILSSDAVKDMTVEEGLAHAVKTATEEKLGKPAARGESKRGKVAKAEARAEKATNTAAELYRILNAAQRKQVRKTTTDEETLALFDQIDNEA